MVASSRRVLALSCSLLASAAAPAWAGTTDAAHRVERIGGSQAAQPVAMLAYPGVGRALVALRNGDIRLVSGDGLVNELLVHVNVGQACPGEGLLGAAWNPAAPGSELYVSYIGTASPRRLILAKIAVDANRKGSTPEVLYQTAASATCTNLGGAITFAADGTVLLGSGDQGRSSDAQLPTNTNGKILRLNPDGRPAAGNILPGSAVYNIGVRNPVAFAKDPQGEIWFVDAGDAASGIHDEVNFVSTDTSDANFGWGDPLVPVNGPVGISGRIDPPASWSPAIGVSGLVSYRADHLGASFAGDLVVSATSGALWRVNTDDGSVVLPTTSRLYVQDATPMPFTTALEGADGFVYLTVASGEVWRFRSSRGTPGEPSSATSIVPLLVRKAAGGTPSNPMVEVSIEKQPDAMMYGPYRGDLMGMAPVLDGNGDTVPDGMSHPVAAGAGAYFCVTTPSNPADAALCAPGVTVTDDPASAYVRFRVPSSFLQPTPCSPPATCGGYVLASARSQARESTVGTSSLGQTIYGGDLDLGCPCPAGSVVGVLPGMNTDGDPVHRAEGAPQCAESFTVQQGLEGTTVLGPTTFPDAWDCKVILMDLSEDWCPFCHRGSADLERLYVEYKDSGFVLVTLVSEDQNHDVATFATLESWRDHAYNPWGFATIPSTNPLLLDENRRVMDRWFNFPDCGGWPQYLLFDAEGLQQQIICGDIQPVIRAAVERELRRAGYIP